LLMFDVNTSVAIVSKNNNDTRNDQQRRRRLATTTTTDETLTVKEEDKFVTKTKEKNFPLFSVSDIITLIGPTSFPKPIYLFQDTNDDDNTIVTNIQPISGEHRKNQDAIFVFAAEYTFQTYILFLMTLYETGYTGDVVVGISSMDYEEETIRELTEYWEEDDESEMRVIVYVVKYHCYNLEGEEKNSHKGGMRVCQCNNLFASRNKNKNNELTPLLDKRHGRTAQTIRYELYWIWSEYYSPHNWILLIDARDTIFQETPFGRVPRKITKAINDDKDNNDDEDGGILIFFGENTDATSLGKSKHNRRWLQLAYGDHVANAFINKPTICSGSTMGEQTAIEMYLRAQVSESDESRTVIFGADQGFHNYLYYSNKLSNAKTIKQIIVQDQGLGIVNNMGALRDKDLSQWGNGKIIQKSKSENIILNWDGTISPIVHQYDRHKELSAWWHRVKFAQFKNQWNKMKQNRKEQINR